MRCVREGATERVSRIELRTSYMATHTEALLDEAMDIIGEVMANE